MRQHETIRVQHDTTHDNTTNNTSQHNTTRVQHDTTRHHTSKTQDNTSIIRYNTSMTRPNTSAKEARTAKIGLYFTFFIIELYIFLIFLEMVNIVLHAILFQPFEYQGVYIHPSEILLIDHGSMTSCAKTEIQIPNTYICPIPLSCFINDNCGFWPSENPV